MAASLAAAAIAAVAATERPAVAAAVAFMAFAVTGAAIARSSRWGRMLPLARAAFSAAQSAAGAFAFWTLDAVFELPTSAVALVGTAVAADLVRRGVRRGDLGKRVALVGTAAGARQLAAELDAAGVRGYQLVGAIAQDEGRWPAADVAERLGSLDDFAGLVEEHAIDLVLIAEGAPRVEAFDAIAEGFWDLPVRVCQLSQFYEFAFGRVPESQIDAAWFRYIMHPSFRSPDTRGHRALDLVVAGCACVVFAPVVLVIAAVIKLHDGGPVIFRQVRIGSGGRPFTLFKLRTMQEEPAALAAWSSEHDPRVTPIGRVLRRTHLDELPQLLNVLRGEMSIIGPRPEQPEFVERLERNLRYYSRRHLIKPGLTGWAQVRCGYAGSDSGSAAKLCYDLFYLKHRTFGLDVAILLETIRTLVADRQFPSELTSPVPAEPVEAPAARQMTFDRIPSEVLDEPTVRLEPAG